MKKKLLNALCMLLVCILALVAFFALIGRIQNDISFLFGRAAVWVLTGSMEPNIPEHSYILLSEVNDPATEIAVGDVITFCSPDPEIRGKLNTHRVVAIDRETSCFVTKGDSATATDVPVPFTQVKGKFIRVLPVLTVIGRFLMTTAGFFVTVILMLALICFVYLPDVIRSFRGRKTSDEPDEKDAYDREIERRIALEVERLKTQEQEQRPKQENEE